MGVGPDQIRLYMDWHRQGWLNQGDGVLDLGAQELFCASSPEQINRFVKLFGGEPFVESDLRRLADRGLAGEMLARAGFRYASIDYKEYPFTIRLDLNQDQLPSEHHRRYRLVTNHGTSEHILNQWNVFKAMHDAAEEGALLFNNVPFSGEFEHGILNYNAKFWWALSEANGYRILRAWAWVDDKPSQVPDSFLSQIEFLSVPLRAPNAWIAFLFQKTNNCPFVGLIDPAFR